MTSATLTALADREVQERMATVWTLRSEARVGSYRHELSSGPWMILASEEAALSAALRAHAAMGE